MGTTIKLITVTDLHRSQGLYEELRDVVSHHRPDVLALVGDFLDCSGLEYPQLSSADSAEAIAKLEVPEIIFVRGNHEDYNWEDFEAAWSAARRRLVKLHGETANVGPALITGFPCYLGNQTVFTVDKPELPYNPGTWLSKLLKKHGTSLRTLWLMHEPPASTPLTAPNSPVAGNSDWNRVIERFSPLLTISGHDHLTPRRTGKWFHRLGTTVCVNVGQTDAGPLHYTVVTMEFPRDSTTSLPVKMRVTAFPRNESVGVLEPAS